MKVCQLYKLALFPVELPRWISWPNKDVSSYVIPCTHGKYQLYVDEYIVFITLMLVDTHKLFWFIQFIMHVKQEITQSSCLSTYIYLFIHSFITDTSWKYLSDLGYQIGIRKKKQYINIPIEGRNEACLNK